MGSSDGIFPLVIFFFYLLTDILAFTSGHVVLSVNDKL